MTKQRTVVSRLTSMREASDGQAEDRHLLARRLLGLPHVTARLDEGIITVLRKADIVFGRWSTRRNGPKASMWP